MSYVTVPFPWQSVGFDDVYVDTQSLLLYSLLAILYIYMSFTLVIERVSFYDSFNGYTCVVFQHTVKPGSYAWKYHRPPPRRSNVIDMDAIFDVFEQLIAEDEMNIFDAEDFENDDLSSMEMALLLMQLDFESSDSSSDEENFLY